MKRPGSFREAILPNLFMILPVFTGAVLRTGWLIINPHTICWDEIFYDQDAIRVAQGLPYGLPFFPPGWSLTTGLLYRLFGENLNVVFGFNTLISIAVIILAGLLGQELFNRRTGVIAMWLVALAPSYILVESLDLYQLFLQCLLLTAVWLGVRKCWSWPTAAFIGILSGLSSLMRPFWLVLPILLYLGFLALRSKKLPLKSLILAQGIAGIIIFSWIAYISIENNRFIPVSLNASLNFWMANNSKATGTHVPPPPEYFDPQNEPIVREAAMSYFLAHPLRTFKLIPARLYYMYYGEAMINWVFQSTNPPVDSTVVKDVTISAYIFYWIELVGSAAAIIYLLVRKKFKSLVLLGILVFNTLSYMPFTGQLIYRWPVQFVIVIYAAVLIDILPGSFSFLRSRLKPATTLNTSSR